MKKLIILTLCAVLPVCSYAQRTAVDEMAIKASYVYPFVKGGGIEVSFSQYQMIGFWEAEVNITNRKYLIDNSEYAESPTYTARGGYMFRIVATRSRRLNVYGGAGAILGAGQFKASELGWTVIKTKTALTSTGDVTYFTFGVYPKLETEFFFADNVALSLCGKLPMMFIPENNNDLLSAINKMKSWFNYEISLGIKVNF